MNEPELKKVYAYFEKKSNLACVYIMEAVVGLMRNMKRADAMSVELYTKKFEGFMIGINRIDHKKINFDNCEEYKKTIISNGYEASIEGNKDLVCFVPLKNILMIICNLAEHAKEEVAIENFIEKA